MINPLTEISFRKIKNSPSLQNYSQIQIMVN